jgi:hypothetical protein
MTFPAHMLAYLATPYSQYAAGIEAAFADAARLASRLVGMGITVYSPVVHGHPLSIHGGLEPRDHDLWLALDRPMMVRCDVLIVAQLPGWQESEGIAAEVDAFLHAGKPIYDLDPLAMLLVRRRPDRRRLGEMTIEELTEERAYWDARVCEAAGWGGALGAASEFRDTCDALIARRQRHDSAGPAEKSVLG